MLRVRNLGVRNDGASVCRFHSGRGAAAAPPDTAAPPAAASPSSEALALGQCVVCFAQPLTHTFIPCGHMCVCAACAESVFERSKRCPICTQDAIMFVQIHVTGIED